MKKALLLLLAGVLVACTGCAHTAAKEPKACKVEVYSDGGELLKTIDDQETIELLTPTEDWADAEAPQPEPAAQYELVVWQEKTLLAGDCLLYTSNKTAASKCLGGGRFQDNPSIEGTWELPKLSPVLGVKLPPYSAARPTAWTGLVQWQFCRVMGEALFSVAPETPPV